MIHLSGPEIALEFRDQKAAPVGVLISRHRAEEIARISEPVRTKRTKLRKTKHRSIIFADIAAGRTVGEFDAEAQAARNDGDFAARSFDNSELGDQPGTSLLRHNEQFTVGIVEVAVAHCAIGGVNMNGDADLARD